MEGAPKVGQPMTVEYPTGDGETTSMAKITVLKPIDAGLKGFETPDGISTDFEKKQVLAPEGMRFVILKIKVENVGKKPISYAPDGTIIDDQDREFPADGEAATGLIENKGSMTWAGNDLLPTRSVTEYVVFPIPIGAAPKTVLIHTAGEPLPVSIDTSDLKWFHPRGQ
jgi:Domain of unknown function (DUF4352)